jgi:hypothetical protein
MSHHRHTSSGSSTSTLSESHSSGRAPQTEGRGYLVLRTSAPDANADIDTQVDAQLADIRHDLAARGMSLDPEQEVRLKAQIKAALKLRGSQGSHASLYRRRSATGVAATSSFVLAGGLDSNDEDVPVAPVARAGAGSAAGIVEGIPLAPATNPNAAVEEERLLNEVIGELGGDGVALAGNEAGILGQPSRPRTKWQRFKRFLREKGPGIGGVMLLGLGVVLVIGVTVIFPPAGLALIVSLGAGALVAGTIGAAENARTNARPPPPPAAPIPEATIYPVDSSGIIGPGQPGGGDGEYDPSPLGEASSGGSLRHRADLPGGGSISGNPNAAQYYRY